MDVVVVVCEHVWRTENTVIVHTRSKCAVIKTVPNIIVYQYAGFIVVEAQMLFILHE